MDLIRSAESLPWVSSFVVLEAQATDVDSVRQIHMILKLINFLSSVSHASVLSSSIFLVPHTSESSCSDGTMEKGNRTLLCVVLVFDRNAVTQAPKGAGIFVLVAWNSSPPEKDISSLCVNLDHLTASMSLRRLFGSTPPHIRISNHVTTQGRRTTCIFSTSFAIQTVGGQ